MADIDLTAIETEWRDLGPKTKLALRDARDSDVPMQIFTIEWGKYAWHDFDRQGQFYPHMKYRVKP
jgi:hypothetical protein